MLNGVEGVSLRDMAGYHKEASVQLGEDSKNLKR